MREIQLMCAGLMASVAMAAADEVGAETVAEATEKKSIVPTKYAGKYKNGGSDALANFINEQCTGKEGFEYPAFFSLARTNDLPEEKVAHYEQLVAEKAHGSQGRARMTLRNMLATIARKNGELKGLNGEMTTIELAKPALSGAAAKAQETASQTSDADDTSEGDGEGSDEG